MVAAYFNDTKVKRCGICDNCLREKNLTITKQEFEKIRNGIKSTISARPVNTEQLIHNMQGFKENKIWKILNFLQEENQVSITKDGLIAMRS